MLRAGQPHVAGVLLDEPHSLFDFSNVCFPASSITAPVGKHGVIILLGFLSWIDLNWFHTNVNEIMS